MSEALVSCDRQAPWLRRITANWNPPKPLKYLARINPEALGESTNPERSIQYVDIGSVDSLGRIAVTQSMTFKGAPSRARRIVRHGDTIVSTVRTYLKAVAAIEQDDPDLIASTGFAVVRSDPKCLLPRFAFFWLRSTPFVDEVCARSVGVSYPATNASEIGAIPVPLPPLPAQRTIAAFLDRKTAAIDALIEKKERLIALLAEKRSALIHQAVTKGLDPNVPMKDSGVPWIGEIPAHWRSMRLKHVSERVVVGIAAAATHAYVDDGVPILRSTNVRANRIDEADVLQIAPWYSDQNRSKYLRAGDLVTVRTGAAGVTAVVPEHLDYCQCFTMLITTPRSDQCAAFLSYYLNAEPALVYFSDQSWGTAQKNISVPILQNAPVLVPPREEQRGITEHLDETLAAHDGLASACRASVARLREYRQALITAAVTGQLEIPEDVPA